MSVNKDVSLSEAQERRAALRESLPGLLFAVFVLLTCLVGLIWFVVR